MAPPEGTDQDPDETEEMSIYEILCGKGDYFPGLIPLIQAYLESVGCDAETGETMRLYLDLIKARASGELQTPAQWMRSIVTSHPDYKKDSIVPQSVAAELVRACVDVAEGRRQAPALLGKHRIAPLRTEDAWYVPLRRELQPSSSRRAALLERYASRAAGTAPPPAAGSS
jgi:glutamate--cysteine ligase catalytic subunit